MVMVLIFLMWITWLAIIIKSMLEIHKNEGKFEYKVFCRPCYILTMKTILMGLDAKRSRLELFLYFVLFFEVW